MPDTNTPEVKIELTVDDKSVKTSVAAVGKEVESQGNQSGQGFGDSFSKGFGSSIRGIFSGRSFPIFTELNAALNLSTIAINAFSRTARSAFDFAFKGENEQRVLNQFDQISASAGVSGQKIRIGLDEATAGIENFGEAVRASQSAVLRLGLNAEKIPEIFTLARKSTQLFGGDVTQNFERIVQAVQSGNVKLIRSITGVSVNLEKAQLDYANATNQSVKVLTEFEKQQIAINALLDESTRKYQGVSLETNSLSASFARLQETANGFFDGLAIAFNNALGPFFTALINGANKSIEVLSRLLNLPTGTLEEQIERQTVKVRKLAEQLARLGVAGDSGSRSALTQGIQEQNEILNQLIEKQRLLNQTRQESEIEAIRINQNEKQRLIDLANTAAQVSEQVQEVKIPATAWENYVNSAKDQINDLQSTFQIGIVQSLSAGFAQVGRSLVDGANSFREFGKAILGVLGGILVQVGTATIALGVAGKFVPFLGIKGFGAVAAGAALVTLGGALQALSSKGNSLGGQTAVTATSGAGVGLPAVVTQSADQDRIEPETVINVNIEGLIADNDESGLRLVNILNNAFDRQGLTVRRGFA